jgi:GNAT superfamily N-acetyltransferase
MSAVSVRPVLPEDKDQWLRLWHEYNIFYGEAVADDVTEATWQRLMSGYGGMGCIVACEWPDGGVLGFINYIVHPRTWSTTDVCYLEDLYVDEAARGKGIGRQLCEAIKHLGERKGLSRVYWNTRADNSVARKLYDQIATQDDFVRYVMPLEA